MTVIGEANNVAELFKVLEQVAANMILLDIPMPGESRLGALRGLHQKYPHVPVLILTFPPEHRFAVRALKAGASGYMLKESAMEECVQSVRKIAGGSKSVSAALAEELATELED